MPVIPALDRLRKEDPKFQDMLSYIARPCIKTNKQTKKKTGKRKRSDAETEASNMNGYLWSPMIILPHSCCCHNDVLKSKICFIFIIIHLFTCACIIWVISPPFSSQFQAGPVLP
jgi:hypothetical protein